MTKRAEKVHPKPSSNAKANDRIDHNNAGGTPQSPRGGSGSVLHATAKEKRERSEGQRGSGGGEAIVLHIQYRSIARAAIVACVLMLGSWWWLDRNHHQGRDAGLAAVPKWFVVDDLHRPGLLYNRSTITVRRPVIMVPGLLSSALEVWDNHPCAGTLAKVGTLFRERMFGPQMLLHLLNDPECYGRHLGLSKEVFGEDPVIEDMPEEGESPFSSNSADNEKPSPIPASEKRRVRVRPAGWLDAADYLVPGFWVWARAIRSLADIGYDPNTMILMPYDWRLSPQLMQRRDGYFHRLRGAVEEAVRVSGGVKAVIASQSLGGVVVQEFLLWAEAERPGWTDTHLHAIFTVCTPSLGVAQGFSLMLSGEIRDTAYLPAVARATYNAFMARATRIAVTRTVPGITSLFPRGGDLLWPDVVSLFNQTVHLRGSDVIAALAQVATDSGHSGLVSALGELRTTYDTLPHLPQAPNLKVFAFYGVNIPAETGYAYTLAQDELESDVQLSTADARELLRAGVSPRAVGAHMTHAGDAFAAAEVMPAAMDPHPSRKEPTMSTDRAVPATVDEWRAMVQEAVGLHAADMAATAGDLTHAPAGALWHPAFLGNTTRGTALDIDASVFGIARPAPLPLSPHGYLGQDTYYAGIRDGPGDGIVSVLSLGYMARAPDGWALDVGADNIIVKEFLHRKDAAAHHDHSCGENGAGSTSATTGSVGTGAKSSLSSGKVADHHQRPCDGVTNTPRDVAKVSVPEAPSSWVVASGRWLQRIGMPAQWVLHITTAFDFIARYSVKVANPRGGTASADHVDIIGNYELITDLLHIATGNDHRVRPRILSDIDTRIAEITRRRKDP